MDLEKFGRMLNHHARTMQAPCKHQVRTMYVPCKYCSSGRITDPLQNILHSYPLRFRINLYSKKEHTSGEVNPLYQK